MLVALVASAPAWALAGGAVHGDGCGLVLRAAEADPLAPAVPEDHPAGLEQCIGRIRPGAPMSSPFRCTLNFVFRDEADNLYIGTAGHCTQAVGQRVATDVVGFFGTVVYRRVQGANDFALVAIDADKRGLVSPTLCQWGGPVGEDPGSRLARDVLLEYGWGIATGSNLVSRARMHVEQSSGPGYVEWVGAGSGGDSGAPVVNQAGYAVAIHTYGLTPIAGVVSEGGPSIASVLAMGRTVVPTLELVPGDATSLENRLRELTY